MQKRRHQSDGFIIIILLLAFIFCPISVFANDSSFGGIGADLSPQKRSDVLMLSEDIKAVETGQGVWAIEAKYVFKNPTDKQVKFTMGFPERLCYPESDCASPSGDNTTFRDIVTVVDGTKVKTQVKSVGGKDKKWSELGRVHLFEIQFEPKQTRIIKHKYFMGISTSIEGERSFQYITKTGAMWGAPIGKAKFSISVRRRPIGFHFLNEYILKDYETQAGNDGLSTVVFEQENWIPSRDLELTFTYGMTQTFGCPQINSYYMETDKLLKRVKQILASPIAKVKPKPEDEFATTLVNESLKLSKRDLRLCRNLPFARHGYQFKSRDLNSRLYQYAQATPLSKMRQDYRSYTYSDDEEELKRFSGVLFRPSKYYSQDRLSKDEWLYIKIMKLIEQSKK